MMKKAALTAYILLVIGWLACVLADANLTTSLAATYFSTLPPVATTRGTLINNKLVIVSPGGNTTICNYKNVCPVRGSIISGNTVLICAYPNINKTALLVKGY